MVMIIGSPTPTGSGVGGVDPTFLIMYEHFCYNWSWPIDLDLEENVTRKGDPDVDVRRMWDDFLQHETRRIYPLVI